MVVCRLVVVGVKRWLGLGQDESMGCRWGEEGVGRRGVERREVGDVVSRMAYEVEVLGAAAAPLPLPLPQVQQQQVQGREARSTILRRRVT